MQILQAISGDARISEMYQVCLELPSRPKAVEFLSHILFFSNPLPQKKKKKKSKDPGTAKKGVTYIYNV